MRLSSEKARKLDLLQNHIGYVFKNAELLIRALTHRSYRKQNNERLEFLGDSILNFVVAEQLFKMFPEADEGQLSRLRSALVSKESLAQVGAQLEIGDNILLGSGELKSGGYRRPSILEDTVEAIIGAIYLDDGIDSCKLTLLAWLDGRLKNLSPEDSSKDSKTKLQELLQSDGGALPEYEIFSIEGEDHDQTFNIVCNIESLDIRTKGRASSRKKAEQKAAKNAIQLIENNTQN